MENGEKVIRMLCHMTIKFRYRSHKCTLSWASDNEDIRWSGASPNSISLYHQPTSLDLYQTSVRSHPYTVAITNYHSYHYYHQPKPYDTHPAHLGPHRLCTHSMSHAYHTTQHALEFMSSGHHMASQAFDSASVSKHWSTILLHHVPFNYHMFYYNSFLCLH